MIQQLDAVVLTKDIETHGLKCGDVGVVVHCYGDGKAFEVEFVTGEGKTIAVLTCNEPEIRPIRKEEILHVRNFISV